jgi:F0F1-type ATP synthase membrane subunit b/b'
MEILQDIATKIGFDWRLAITHLANLLIIFFLLVKLAFPAIKKVVDERTTRIKEGLRLRDEADKIVIDSKKEAENVLRSAKVKSQDNISNSESSAKNILNEASTKSAEIIRLANLERESSKDKGLKEAETLLSKDISRILTQISEKAFSGKVSADVNSDFVSNVFKETYSK